MPKAKNFKAGYLLVVVPTVVAGLLDLPNVIVGDAKAGTLLILGVLVGIALFACMNVVDFLRGSGKRKE